MKCFSQDEILPEHKYQYQYHHNNTPPQKKHTLRILQNNIFYRIPYTEREGLSFNTPTGGE